MITVLQLAEHRGAKMDADDGGFTAEAVESVGLPFFAGCEICEASLVCANAYPSRSGYVRCRSCIGGDGWETVEAANKEIFNEEVMP